MNVGAIMTQSVAARGGGAVIEKDSDDAPEASAAVFSFEVTPARIQ
jgi:hypothetical protein